MTVNTQYDPSVGRPKKQPGEHYRTPPRSFKPTPPEKWPAAQEKIGRINQERPELKPLTMTDVLNHALDHFLSDDWKDWR